MRLIDADELKGFVKEKCSYCTSFIGEESVLSWIDKAPTIEEVDECPQNDTNIGTTDKCDKCFYKSAIKDFELFGEAEPSEQYKKGFEDAKRAFELEYARESENMRKRNAELEVMLNSYREISAEPSGETTETKFYDSNGEVYATITRPSEPSDLISRQDAIKAVEQEYKIDREYMADDYIYGFNQAIQYVSDIILHDLPSTDRPTEYNLETIADIVRQLGHLNSYIADRLIDE